MIMSRTSLAIQGSDMMKFIEVVWEWNYTIIIMITNKFVFERFAGIN